MRWSRLAVLAAVAASYFACSAVATDPVIRTFATELPGELTDPLEHLWIMRWSKACLLEARSPCFSPGLQTPTGVPLGYFPTMHLQTLAYLGLGLVTSNDVAIFNTIWFFGFVSTGLGTFILARAMVGSFWPSWLGGLGTMLCGPMLMHAHGHLETMQMGGVPLFLLAWLRFVDRPTRGQLALAAGMYLLVVAGAPYFAVLCVFPAAWYVAWSGWTTRRDRRLGWARERAGWLVGFGLAAGRRARRICSRRSPGSGSLAAARDAPRRKRLGPPHRRACGSPGRSGTGAGRRPRAWFAFRIRRRAE